MKLKYYFTYLHVIYLFQVIKESVLGCLLDCLPAAVNRERISSATMKEAYVQKMVKVFSEYDRWSLISLSNNSGKNLELKFVSLLRRQFEFSVDSFQIILDPLLESYMQQELQHKSDVINQKKLFADDEHKDSLQRQAPAAETENANGKDVSGKDEVLASQKEQEAYETEQIKQTNTTTSPTVDTSQQEKTPVELKEESPQTDNVNLTDVSDQVPPKTSTDMGNPEQPTEIEIRQEPQLLGQAKSSAEVLHVVKESKANDRQQLDLISQTETCSPLDESEKTRPELEESGLDQRTQQSELPETSNRTQTEMLKLSDPSQYVSVDQGGDQKDKKHVSLSQEKTEEQLAEKHNVETEIEEKTKREEDTEIDKEIKEMRAAKDMETQGIDSSSSPSSIFLSFDNMQSTCTQDTLEITSTYHPDNLEKTHSTLDALSPPDTQDISPAPPSLVSDKKTSSPTSCKASERLSHMVVLKHSSPKPPRRMCRKTAPNSSQSVAPERAPTSASCVELGLSPGPSPEPQTLPDPEQKSTNSDTSSPAISTASTPNSGPEGSLSSDINPHLELTSAPDTTPDLSVLPSADPPFTFPLLTEPSIPLLTADSIVEQIVHNSQSSDCHNRSQSSDSKTVDASGQSDPTNSEGVLVFCANTGGPDTSAPEHTSDVELSDGHESKEDWTRELNLDQPQDDNSMRTASSSPSHCITPPTPCLSPPVLSHSAPCFTPLPPGLSPLQSLTPSSCSFSSAGSSSASPVNNFNSPPPSCSPTSSGLCSPPYLTPPMLSLSPPPLCPTPPSPSLSPPLLCLTPPMESEDIVPQVSSDVHPLTLNSDSEKHFSESSLPPVSIQQPDNTNEEAHIPPLPKVAKSVSFPITIPSATSHSLPAPQCESPRDSAPPKAGEASCSVPENKEVPEVARDMPEQSNNAQASGSVPVVEVLAESMYGDFEAAMDHLRYRLIATRNPEEIRGGGLLKYSNLLVRDYRPASETQIKTLERYMCSRFFIDFPDVQEQQRKILSYLKNHFIGEERSKYQYLMTLRRVVDDSTVCLMGHERRQTLNMITVLALKVLGEQNIIPNTDHVTCFYQPAPYLAEHTAPYLGEPSYCSYYIPQGGSTLLYQPYPLHLHTQTGLV